SGGQRARGPRRVAPEARRGLDTGGGSGSGSSTGSGGGGLTRGRAVESDGTGRGASSGRRDSDIVPSFGMNRGEGIPLPVSGSQRDNIIGGDTLAVIVCVPRHVPSETPRPVSLSVAAPGVSTPPRPGAPARQTRRGVPCQSPPFAGRWGPEDPPE